MISSAIQHGTWWWLKRATGQDCDCNYDQQSTSLNLGQSHKHSVASSTSRRAWMLSVPMAYWLATRFVRRRLWSLRLRLHSTLTPTIAIKTFPHWLCYSSANCPSLLTEHLEANFQRLGNECSWNQTIRSLIAACTCMSQTVNHTNPCRSKVSRYGFHSCHNHTFCTYSSMKC